MHSDSLPRAARAFGGLVFCLALAGCFGTGDGPEPIAGTPAPPPPPSQCDPLTAQGDGAPFPKFFENQPGAYDFGMDAGFGGGATVVVENPVCTAENPTPQVARMQKFNAEPFGGSTLQLGAPVDFSAGTVFTMKVWAQRAVPVTFKFENSATGQPADGIEQVENHSGSGEWETLCFDFSGTPAGIPTNSITFIYDNGVNGDAGNDPDAWTFYMDDIEQASVCPGAPTTTLPVDFEDDPTSYQFANFAGGESDVITNPDQSGNNTTAQTARMRKSSGEIFGGSTLGLANLFDSAQGTAFTMKVWANRPVPVLFKLENTNGDPNAGLEVTENHPGGSTWEDLCFDFGAGANGFPSNSITFIFDAAVNGDFGNNPDDWTFYFDEIEQVANCSGAPPPPPPSSLPVVDFESPATGTGFTWNVFENGDNPGVAFITNPDQSGVNTSATVAEFTARVAGQPFAGTVTEDLPTFTLDASNAIVKLKVWKPVISNVGIKFERADNASTGEILVANTVTNQWEELTFDFTSVIGDAANTDIVRVVIFPDFDARTQENVIYFDDLEFTDGSTPPPPPPPALPVVDFESAAGGTGFTWNVFENGDNPGLAFITNPDQSGVNTSATVAEFTARVAGQPFAGTVTDGLPTFTLDSSNAIVKLKVWKPVISNVGVKFERADNASTGEILVANTVTNQWEELTFDFTSVIGNAANTDIVRVVIFPDFDARTQENVIYFDDLQFTDGSTPPPPPPPTSAPPLIDFESGSLTFNDFDGGMSMLAANPDTGGINPSATALQLQKFPGQTFGGTTIILPGLVDFANGEAYSINVYATRSVDVLFKLEGPNLETTVTHGGTGWETLCFDFTGSAAGTSVDGYTFIFDNGTQGDAGNNPADWTFFVDDIEQVSSCPAGPPALPVLDFESAAGGTGFTWNVFENVDNPALQFISNPDPTGANTSTTVAEFTARLGGQPFAGTVTDGLPTFTLDASNAIVTLKVWKPVISNVGIKFERADNASTGEILVANTVTNQWEELTFDFTSVIGNAANTDIVRVVIFPDFDTRTQDNVIYFDDLTFGSAPPPPPPASLPLVDFESASGGTGFTWNVFENGDNPGVAFLSNPDTTGINTSATAAQFTARVAGQPFAGTVTDGLPTFTLDSTNAVVKLKVYKPVVSNVGIKFERADNASTGEILVANTVVNQWEELTFDFSAVIGDPANTDIVRVVIFPDFDARTQENVIYFDDLEFTDGMAPPPPPPPMTSAAIDFETSGTGAGFTWSVFENVDNPPLQIITNPDQSGANTSATVAEFTARLGGQPFAGTITNDLPTFTLDSSNAIVKIKVWKSVISNVGIKFENGTQGSTGEILVPNTVVNQWEELTFDFTGVIGNPVNTDITGFIVFPDFDTRTQENVIYFDDVSFGDGT